MASGSRQRSNSSGSDARRGTSPSRRDAPTRRIGQPAKAGGSQTVQIRRIPGGKGAQPRGASPTQSRGVRLESRTVASVRRESQAASRDARRRERREQQRKRSRRANMPFIIAGVVLGLAVSFLVMYLILVNTNVFEIEEIDIEGTDHLTGQEVQALVSIPQGTTLLNVDTAAIAQSLERDAWVSSVDVVKVFPNRINIVVHERSIGAIVEVTTGQAQTIQNWAIADDGMWLMIIPTRDTEVGRNLAERIYEDAEAALHIVGVPYGLEPQIGTYCTDVNVNNALAIISGMTTQLADQIKLVNAAESESIMLTLDNNIEIAFGTPDNIRDKERICLQIMEENPTVVYINVRVPDRPTWRSTS